MAAHQIIAGALNKGEHVFGVGSVDGIQFTACAVGSDLVILASNFDRVQVIPAPQSTNDIDYRLVTSVSCCNDSGKIAATYGTVIRVFEPTHNITTKAAHNLNYRWFETQMIQATGTVNSILWAMDGLRLMVVCQDQLFLYQHRFLNGSSSPSRSSAPVMFCIAEEERSLSGDHPMNEWEEVWRSRLAQPVQFIQFSPDGVYFATCGVEDKIVKVWYTDTPVPLMEGGFTEDMQMSFITLTHPAKVTGFEWRKTGRYMPRKCVQNCIITWCEDQTARIWKESTPPESSVLDLAGWYPSTQNNDGITFTNISESDPNLFYESKKKKGLRMVPIKRTKTRIMTKLKGLLPENRKKKLSTSNSEARELGLRAQITKTPSYSDFDTTTSPALYIKFHLAATINADTDCLLVPLMENGSRHQKTFSVHWLNNKELVFSQGAEKLLAEALQCESIESPLSDHSNEERSDVSSNHSTDTTSVSASNTDTVESNRPMSIHFDTFGDANHRQNGEDEGKSGVNEGEEWTKQSNTYSESVSSKDVLDVKLEMLLRQWNKSIDILFTIHPVDGSLITWTVEWLDDLHKSPMVSFTSRLPNAFPLTDAASLHSNLVTFNPHDPAYLEVLRRNANPAQENDRLPEKLAEKRNMNTVYLLTNHDNGSLNLWQLSMEENSLFSTILSITHMSRMCGHRFQISQVVAHPVLPLLLTSSQFGKSEKGQEGRDALSEVILWKINPVGPLCKSGGVQELARVPHKRENAFDYLGWIPAILPSFTLGTVCNSPSSCFVASDGTNLIIYQAVVDARGLLSEIFHSEKPQSPVPRVKEYKCLPSLKPDGMEATRGSTLSDAFKIVSTQSTAKPGCVLEIGKIDAAIKEHSSLLLLHVFNERLLIDNEGEENLDETSTRLGPVVDRSKDIIFTDRYFVVLIEKGATHDSFIMYSIDLSSVPTKHERPLSSISDMDDSGFLRSASPNLPSIANLFIDHVKVCHQRIDLPEGTRIVSAEPAAGHLSSSSLYPACKAPFVILTSCSDDVIRFWKCIRNEKEGTPSFEWKEWRMVSDSLPSELEVDGGIYAISAAHSGRIACAYDSSYQRDLTAGKANKVQVIVFECESSGGVEWLREDTLTIDNVAFPQLKLPRLEDFGLHDPLPSLDGIVADINARPSQRNGSLLTRIGSKSHLGVPMPSSFPVERLITDHMRKAVSTHAFRAQQLYESLKMRDVVRIDWVSTEDGAHILTVGVAANIYLYTQISQDPAQRNIIAMKEAETNMRRPSLRKASSLVSPEIPFQRSQLVRWVCTRVLELHSADGLPPIPTCLTWARDGLLIVGMQSEMRCYCQWNLSAKSTEEKEDSKKTVLMKKQNASAPTLTISPSHSMLEQLNKKGKEEKNKQKMIFEIVNKAMNKDSFAATSAAEVAEAFAQEGLFEAARMANPILPQYHPKQLIVLLNAGRTKRVKAILLHVLKSLKGRRGEGKPNPLSRAASIRRMSRVEGSVDQPETTQVIQIDEGLDYDEIDDIAPLPLYSLMAADEATDQSRNENNATGPSYDGLFAREEDEDLDAMLADDDDGNSSAGGRSRLVSTSSDPGGNQGIKAEETVQVVFTAKHNRILTEYLTHTHLPGLSSVDQMHLLAIADTLSHFSADVMDKLAQANAAMNPVAASVLGESGGYATATAGVETIDECGLRFLMAMKQHEYLLLCLPIKQRQQLRIKGLSSAHVIWATHSDTENELLNAVPAMQKTNFVWDDLRGIGAAWWLKNQASLRICVEKLAKSAFQLKQDPMDAALFYLALRKKNVLTHLFKTSSNQMMMDFFQQDFSTDHWKKAAQKNAFVLMSKQRFQHAAAFFLLAGSLKDALQTILAKLNDIQLAMVVLRLYETDTEVMNQQMRDLLCREILDQTVEQFEDSRGRLEDDTALHKNAHQDPFVRSMAYWVLKDYSRAAHTLVVEANSLHVSSQADVSLSNIFNFYSFLRKHPLVIRQRLTDAGVQVGSTEKFLAVARRLEVLITPPERRLYFRTAGQHMALGCPMLALDVLSRLPKEIAMLGEGSESLRDILSQEVEEYNMTSMPLSAKTSVGLSMAPTKNEENVDWSAPTNVVGDDDLELGWSESDDDEDEEPKKEEIKKSDEKPLNGVHDDTRSLPPSSSSGIVDIIAQHMKFVASLRILTEELSTLASGYEVDGGQLRYQLFHWLEKEVDVLKRLCDYRTSEPEEPHVDEPIEDHVEDWNSPSALHEVISKDRALMAARYKIAMHRRKWLVSNQKLLRSFTSFCALHSAQNHRLTSALMELLLLLLELQKDNSSSSLRETLPDMNSFPLLVASVSSYKMFVSSPLAFIENQCYDLLMSISELVHVPKLDHSIKKVFILYNLCQGLSSCVYQSLSDVDYYNTNSIAPGSGALTRRSRAQTSIDDIRVTTQPGKWPGVENVVALLGRERDEDAPQLRLLLAECFVAITMSLFSFALSAYDARWLFRLSAHFVDNTQFANIFGGGGEKKLKAAPPARPPRPAAPSVHVDSNSIDKNPQVDTVAESLALRAKLHAKVFGIENHPVMVKKREDERKANEAAAAKVAKPIEQTIYRWVPPKKNIVQMYAEKIYEDLGDDVDCVSEAGSEDEEHPLNDDEEPKDYANPNSYAWTLMRLALVVQQSLRLKQFLVLSGFDLSEIPCISPRVNSVIKMLEGWAYQLREELRAFPDGCPPDLLPNKYADVTEETAAGPTLRKYRALLEPSNTPFENEGPHALPVKRLWIYLVRQENLQNIFIANVFAPGQNEKGTEKIGASGGANKENLPEAYKIIQKENEPIVAFSCSQERPGLLVVSTGRELQEMDISPIFEENANSTWMSNRTELDVALFGLRRDAKIDNDDYQLFTDGQTTKSSSAKMMFKRPINGIRRIDAHPSAPYYATGSSDGSIRIWEWGVGQPLFIPRHAGQHAKVTRISYSPNGSKVAAADGDGMVCVWQAGVSSDMKMPFFSMKAHNRTTSDVRFVSHSSSILLTAGDATSEANVCLWDTLLPSCRSCVHAFGGDGKHFEGATCALYLAPSMTVISGGAHGDLCIWDLRMGQLRNQIKVFEPMQSVSSLVVDPSNDVIAIGNSEGDIKIYSCEPNPQLMYSLPGEHAAKTGFSFRQVGQTTVTGVQQLYVDQDMRMFSCGADCSLNFRTIPSVYNLI